MAPPRVGRARRWPRERDWPRPCRRRPRSSSSSLTCAVTESLNSRIPAPSWRPREGSRLGPKISSTIAEHDQQLKRPDGLEDGEVHRRSGVPYALRRLAAHSKWTDGPVKSSSQRSDVGRRPHQVMNQPSENSHYVRRVVLPSGREIEVVYFDAQAAPADAAPIVTNPHTRLHECPDCDRGSSTRWNGRRPPRRSGRCCSAAPTASGPTSASTTRPSSIASTRSSTAARRRWSTTSCASSRPTWKTRSSASPSALASDAIWPMDF